MTDAAAAHHKIHLRIHPGAIVHPLVLAAMFWFVAPLYDGLALTATALPTRTGPAWLFAACFLSIYLLGVFTHEAGHVAAARTVGGRLERVSLGLTIGVGIETPGPRTNAQQARISFWGPATQIGLGGTLLALGATLPSWDSPIFFGALLVLLEGAANLLLPLGRNSDAHKLFRSSWRCLRGRAEHPFRPEPSLGECLISDNTRERV